MCGACDAERLELNLRLHVIHGRDGAWNEVLAACVFPILLFLTGRL
jgi:hypothetical protein